MACFSLRAVAIALLLLSSLTTGACTIRTADLTLATNRLVELDRVDLDMLPTRKRVKGEDTKFLPFFLVVPALQPSLETAIDNALTAGNGDLLTDAVVKIRNLYVVLGFVLTLSVEGDVVDTRQRGLE